MLFSPLTCSIIVLGHLSYWSTSVFAGCRASTAGPPCMVFSRGMMICPSMQPTTYHAPAAFCSACLVSGFRARSILRAQFRGCVCRVCWQCVLAAYVGSTLWRFGAAVCGRLWLFVKQSIAWSAKANQQQASGGLCGCKQSWFAFLVDVQYK